MQLETNVPHNPVLPQQMHGDYAEKGAQAFFESTAGWVQAYSVHAEERTGVFQFGDDETTTETPAGVVMASLSPSAEQMLTGSDAGLGVLTLDWYYSEAGYDNSLRVFTVDDADATIDGVAASDSATYHSKAIANSVMSLSRPQPEPGVESPPSANQTSGVFEIGDYYSFYVGQNGGGHPHVWFPFVEGNVDDYAHFSGSNVEDLCQTPGVCPNPGGYALDTDHNDVMYTAAEKLLVKVDVDVDSDNDSSSGAPARSTAEESIEEDAPGKVLAVGVGQRKPAVIEAEVGADFNASDFTFTIAYDSSNIRLYDSADVDTGVFIPTGTTFTSLSAVTKDELLAAGGATIYMDGIALGGCDITLTASKTSGAHSGNSISDKARVTVALDLDTDSDNDGTIESTQNYNAAGTAEDMIEDDVDHPGKVIPLNKDDDNGNGEPDYDDDNDDYPCVHDDDFATIELAFSGLTNGDLNGYELRLTADAGLNLWADEYKVTLADSSNPPDSSGGTSDEWYVWDIDASLPSLPTTLYVEGVSAGNHHVYWRLKDGSDTIVARDTVEFTVVDANLTAFNGGSDLDNGEATGSDGAAVDEDDEESVGAYLLVNWDDDDADGQMNANGSFSQLPVPDLTETSVQNEDNLAKLVPAITPSLSTGIVELEVTAGASMIKLWTQKTKETEITLTSSKKTWDLSNSSQRSDFESVGQNGIWIEGIATSAAERDVTLVLRYKYGSQEITSDTVKATVVMINLGNAVYRNGAGLAAGKGHAALVTSYTGACTRTDLISDANFVVTEMQADPLGVRTVALTTMTQAEGLAAWGCFTNTAAITYVARLRILMWADAILDLRPNGGVMGYQWNDALLPRTWDNALNTITHLRCDGLVEVCYEANGINVWGAIDGGATHYDIRDDDYQEEHNNFDLVWWTDTLMPATQCGHVTPVDAATTFVEQDLCTPVGSTGGN